jgi:sugar O-acyltransferase (sialic acid O-acetyltransferase NeuD family)
MRIALYGDGNFSEELQSYINSEYFYSRIITISKDTNIDELNFDFLILASGHPHIKEKMYGELKKDYEFISICKGTCLGTIEKGSVVAPGAVVAPYSHIKSHVLINYNASVGHHVKIENFTTVSPNAFIGGNCTLGKSVYIGGGASVKEGVTIGDNSVVGLGAVVLKNVPKNCIVVGNPGIVIKKDEWDEVKDKLFNTDIELLRNGYE